MAMTGEITLRGAVLPVGGIQQKVHAAARAGIHRVLLPQANQKDGELVKAALPNLEIVCVESLYDVIQVVFGIMRPSPLADIMTSRL